MMDDISKRCPTNVASSVGTSNMAAIPLPFESLGIGGKPSIFWKLLYQISFTRPNSHESPGTAALVSLGLFCPVFLRFSTFQLVDSTVFTVDSHSICNISLPYQLTSIGSLIHHVTLCASVHVIITSAVDITWFQLVMVCRLVEPENCKLQNFVNCDKYNFTMKRMTLFSQFRANFWPKNWNVLPSLS